MADQAPPGLPELVSSLRERSAVAVARFLDDVAHRRRSFLVLSWDPRAERVEARHTNDLARGTREHLGLE